MLFPSKTKYRKQRKGKIRGLVKGGQSLILGSVGLLSLNRGFLTAKQIETARIVLTRHVKRGGKVLIRIFPDKPLTKKPAEVRMGKGKGTVSTWVAVIKPGCILYEISGIDEKLAIEALHLAGNKLPLQTKIIRNLVEF